MANKRINDLPVVTSTTTGDVVPIDGATTRGVTVENLLGDNVQSIKDLTSAADKVAYFTGAGTSGVADFTAYGRSIVATADEAGFKTLVNLEIGVDVQAYDSDLTAFAGKTAPSGDVVGTTDVQTLTQKTLTSPVINGMTGSLDSSVTGTTQSSSDNSTKIATTAYVDAQVAGSVAGVASLNGQTGTLVLNVAPQGRLTLASGVPVMATSQAAKTTVYYTPYAGNIVPIYDGTNMVPTVFAELSQATTDTTKSPAAVAATKIYDLFVWNDGGTIRCTRGPAWTNATTRGYTLTMVNGILLNTSSITNGPAASRGTWVGTIASNASSSIDYIFPGAGPVQGVFNVWNAYNRVDVGGTLLDTGAAAYTYTSSTHRQARATAANRIDFVYGANDEPASALYTNICQTVAAASGHVHLGIGYDSTTVVSATTALSGIAAQVLYQTFSVPLVVSNPAPGTHFFTPMEASDASNANTFNLGGTSSNVGMSVRLKM